jgi:hypothetical protein
MVSGGAENANAGEKAIRVAASSDRVWNIMSVDRAADFLTAGRKTSVSEIVEIDRIRPAQMRYFLSGIRRKDQKTKMRKTPDQME